MLAFLVGKPRLRTNTFGKWLEQARRGRSHAALAGPMRELLKPIGMKVPPTSLWKMEQEGRVPNVPMLYALSRVLKVPTEEVLLLLVSDLGISVSEKSAEEIAAISRVEQPADSKTGAGIAVQTAGVRHGKRRRATHPAVNRRLLAQHGVDEEIIQAVIVLLDALTERRGTVARPARGPGRPRSAATSHGRADRR